MGPNATAAHQQQLNEDNRQALVLFGIVLIFFVSNVPRILLNLHEVSWWDLFAWLSQINKIARTVPHNA